MMYGKSLTLYCILPIIASSSTLWSNLTSDNEEKDYSTTVRYQLDANTMKNYNDGEDWYNLHENFTTNNDDMEYRINFTNNNHERLMIDHFIQYKSQAHENDSQISVNSRINSTEFDSRRNFISQEFNDSERIKGNNNSTYDSFNNFNRNNSEINIIPHKMCDDITCIRLCCPFGNPNRLVNGKCIPGPGYFVVLRNTNGYINDSFQNESEKVDNKFLFVVHVPCQKTGHYLMNPYSIPTQNKFLVNGSLYLPYYNTIVEPTSYCLAVVDYNIFDVNVCFEIMKKIRSKTTKNNKDIIYPINNTNKNLENTKSKNEYTSREYFKNSNTVNTKSNIVSYEMCDNITCIRICCPFGSHLIKGKCIGQQNNFIFLRNMFGYINDSSRNESKKIDELFLLIVHDPCQKTGYHWFNPYSSTLFLANGSLYLSHHNTIIEPTSYCLANIAQNKFTVNVCLDIMKKITNKTISPKITNKIKSYKRKNVFFPNSSFMIVFFCGELGVILSSLMMFIVYSILPELRNIHGFILRRYSGSVFVAYTIFLIIILIEKDALGDYIYIIFGFVLYHAFFGSYFWLNVMSFNIWRTFRQLHSSQRMMKQKEKKMLKFYSIYAWGVPFIIHIPFVLYIVPVIQNNFGLFGRLAYWYYYGIIIISVTSNIYLSFFTARKIAYFEKNVAHRLSNSEKQRYNDQKHWFKMQLEVTIVLFIIFCIQTCIIIYMLVYMYVLYNNDNDNDNDNDNVTLYAQYTLFALDVIQHFYVFIIFVLKKKCWKCAIIWHIYMSITGLLPVAVILSLVFLWSFR